jgi:hypothetical protein
LLKQLVVMSAKGQDDPTQVLAQLFGLGAANNVFRQLLPLFP